MRVAGLNPAADIYHHNRNDRRGATLINVWVGNGTGETDMTRSTVARGRRAMALGSTCLAACLYLEPSIASAADGPPMALDEVVVTARKRDENIQNIPVAVTAVSAKKLDDYGLRDIESIARSTPQLSVVRGNNGSGATISVRGIGSTYTSIGIEQ
jgi:iron complex outermembrane receptor protein